MQGDAGPRFLSPQKNGEMAMKFHIFGLVASAAFSATVALGQLHAANLALS
jgi:hypothetical protein